MTVQQNPTVSVLYCKSSDLHQHISAVQFYTTPYNVSRISMSCNRSKHELLMFSRWFLTWLFVFPPADLGSDWSCSQMSVSVRASLRHVHHEFIQSVPFIQELRSEYRYRETKNMSRHTHRPPFFCVLCVFLSCSFWKVFLAEWALRFTSQGMHIQIKCLLWIKVKLSGSADRTL